MFQSMQIEDAQIACSSMLRKAQGLWAVTSVLDDCEDAASDLKTTAAFHPSQDAHHQRTVRAEASWSHSAV